LLHRLFLSLVDVLPSAPLPASLVSFACHCLDRRTGRRIAHASLSSAAPLAGLIISICGLLRRSPDSTILSLAR
jgi:hypothetical protein